MNNQDFGARLLLDIEAIEYSLEELADGDPQLNYLYFLRDEINKQIKKVNKKV